MVLFRTINFPRTGSRFALSFHFALFLLTSSRTKPETTVSNWVLASSRLCAPFVFAMFFWASAHYRIHSCNTEQPHASAEVLCQSVGLVFKPAESVLSRALTVWLPGEFTWKFMVIIFQGVLITYWRMSAQDILLFCFVFGIHWWVCDRSMLSELVVFRSINCSLLKLGDS